MSNSIANWYVLATVIGQEYSHGRLMSEEFTSAEFKQRYKLPKVAQKSLSKATHIFKPLLFRHPQRNTQNKMGETVYKGHRSYDLMLNLQVSHQPTPSYSTELI
jgi:hypothetical protein